MEANRLLLPHGVMRCRKHNDGGRRRRRFPVKDSVSASLCCKNSSAMFVPNKPQAAAVTPPLPPSAPRQPRRPSAARRPGWSGVRFCCSDSGADVQQSGCDSLLFACRRYRSCLLSVFPLPRGNHRFNATHYYLPVTSHIHHGRLSHCTLQPDRHCLLISY